MEEKQCQALKLNKERCTRAIRKGSKYCWQHILSRRDDARWYNNTRCQVWIGVAGILATVLFGIITLAAGPTKTNQKEILERLDYIAKRLRETIPPVLTKEDAERPLSVEEQNLVAEYEKLKRIAEQANLKAQLSLNAQLSHAGAMLRLARYKEAETAYRTIIVGHPDNTDVMTGLGIVLYQIAKYEEAEELFQEALLKDEASLGPEHPNVAIRLNNLAQLYQATNRLKEAEPLMERALKIDEASLGKNHPNVAIRLNNLAALYQATNRFAQAEPLMERALKIDEAALGEDHPDVARDLNNLALLYKATNRLKEAESMMEREMIIYQEFNRRTGHRHPHLDIVINNYSGLLMEMGHSRDEVNERLKGLAPEMFESTDKEVKEE